MAVPDWDTVTDFENKIAEFFGAPYAVSTDSCTSALELVLRYKKFTYLTCPTHTYLSIPMLSKKLNIPLVWKDDKWEDYYNLSCGVRDAAVLWHPKSFTFGFFCVSFQYQKHLALGRGGMILCDRKEAAEDLRRMSYDGRERGIPWREQNIKTTGFHYYMTPETAQLGLDKLSKAIEVEPKKWSYTDYPDLTKMEVFIK